MIQKLGGNIDGVIIVQTDAIAKEHDLNIFFCFFYVMLMMK